MLFIKSRELICVGMLARASLKFKHVIQVSFTLDLIAALDSGQLYGPRLFEASSSIIYSNFTNSFATPGSILDSRSATMSVSPIITFKAGQCEIDVGPLLSLSC